MKTYQLTIRPERKGQKLESKLLAKGEAANATEFYNKHLKTMIDAIKGFDAGVANVSQIGGTESVSTTVYPDDVVSSNATGEQQVEPAGREGREFDPVKGFFDEMVKKNPNVVEEFKELCDRTVEDCKDRFNNYHDFRDPIFNLRPLPEHGFYENSPRKKHGIVMDTDRWIQPGDPLDGKMYGVKLYDLKRDDIVMGEMAKAQESVRAAIRAAGHDPDKVHILSTNVESVHDRYTMVVEYLPRDIYP